MQNKKMNERIEDMMPASPDEKSMALRQAKFIEYVAEEIEEYLENNRAFPEWMQNKLSALHQKAKDMHAVLAGDYEDDEEEDDEDMNEDVKKMSHGRLKYHMNNKNTPHGSYSFDQMKAERDRRLKTGQADAYKSAKMSMSEDVKINELSKKTLGSYIKKATGDAVTKARRSGDVRDKDSGQNYMKALGRQIGISKATNKLTKEGAQLDELSPNTLHRYVKKATGSVAGTAAGMGADAAKGKVDPKKARTLNNRMKGISGASGRMSDMANQNESYINEKLSVDDGMGAWIDDFKKSDAPQFKGKSDKERRDMAIAAYLNAKKGPQNEKFVSAAQRRAVWATKADGGKGHPDNKGKKK